MLVELVQTSQRLYWLSNLWQDGEDEDPRDRDCLEAARLLERIGLPTTMLMQAIHAAGARRGRLSRAERIPEQTLLEVLTEAMRRAR
jgi:hypothetical protein